MKVLEIDRQGKIRLSRKETIPAPTGSGANDSVGRVSILYRKLILENGIRLVTERIPTLKSVTVGIWVNTGSRDESPAQAGYSHFIEHMFFKGTTARFGHGDLS